MDDRPRPVLAQLLAQHGPTLYEQPGRCRSLLLDHLAGTCEAEVNLLHLTLQYGIVQDLLDAVGQPSADVLLLRLTQKLCGKMPIDAAAARWAVESWAMALDIISTAVPQSAARPAPPPTPGQAAIPFPGHIDLALTLTDALLELSSGDTVRGDVQQTLTIASPLGGRLEVPPQEVVRLDGTLWQFADGTMLQGALTTEEVIISTARRPRRLRVGHLKPLCYSPQQVTGSLAQGTLLGTLLGTVQGDLLVGHLQGPLTFVSPAESLDLEPEEIVFLANGRCTLDDGTRLSGQIVAPNPLVMQTRYGIVQVPSAQVQRLHYGLVNALGMVFVHIPAGEFLMGSEQNDDEKPLHPVRLTQPFYLGMTPVTQGQWQAVMGTNPSHFVGAPTRPVEQVSWDDVQAFLKRLNTQEGRQVYRLPTEAQWEYAARAGSTAAYCFGDDAAQLQHYAWYNANASGTTHPVGKLWPNAWGLYDVHGNVWEWVQDWYAADFYKHSAGTPAVDPTGPAAGSDRVMRGGSWYYGAGHCRAADRGHAGPGFRSVNLGFRLLREVS